MGRRASVSLQLGQGYSFHHGERMVILYWVLILVMFVGVVGAMVPGLPGASLILLAIVIWGLIKGFIGLGVVLATAVIVLLVSIGIDFLATYWGAKQAGASQWGQTGSLIGLGLGIFGLLPALPFGGPLLGMLIGPFLGALIGELLYRRELAWGVRIKISGKAALGIIVGSLVGNIIQGMLALGAMIVFLVTTWGAGFSS